MPDPAPPACSFTTVAEGAARGQRLDRFLADAIGTVSRSRVKSLIEQGQLRRDGQVCSEPAEPVRPGATLRVESEITEISPSRTKPDRGVVTVRSVTLNQNGEQVQVMTAKLLVFRRPADATLPDQP